MTPHTSASGKDAELHAQLQFAFEYFNKALFKGELPVCVITLQANTAYPAYFTRDGFSTRDGHCKDLIVMNPIYFAEKDHQFILSALVHEMCHAWQKHFGKPGRGRYHNAEWAEKMTSLGLIPTHNAQKGGRPTGDRVWQLVQDKGMFDVVCARLLSTGFSFDVFKVSNLKPQPPGHINAGIRMIGNRLKYTCGCLTNFWGKPNIMAVCCVCNSPFTCTA